MLQASGRGLILSALESLFSKALNGYFLLAQVGHPQHLKVLSMACYDCFFSSTQLTFSLTSPRCSSLLPEGGIHRFCSFYPLGLLPPPISSLILVT